MVLREMAAEAKGVFCFTHAPDFDGISSAALVVRYLKAPTGNVFFGYPHLEGLKREMGKLLSARPSGSLVVFTDIAVNDAAVPYILESISGLKQLDNRVAWIDHHPWSEYAARELEGACDFLLWGEGDECAAEKVISALGLSDGYAAKIGRLAHLGDFNLPGATDEPLLGLAQAITYLKTRGDPYPGLRELVGLVSRDDLHGSFVRDSADSYVRDSAAELSRLKDDCSLHEVNGYRIGIGYARNLQSNQACDVIEGRLRTDLEIFINTNGYHLSMRSRKGVDCSLLASALGGGGHPQAAGATLQLKDDSEIGEGIAAILEKAKAALPGR